MKKTWKKIVSFICVVTFAAGILPGSIHTAASNEKITVKASLDEEKVLVNYPAGMFLDEEISVVCYGAEWNKDTADLATNIPYAKYLDQKSVSSAGGNFEFLINEEADPDQTYSLVIGAESLAEPVVTEFAFEKIEPEYVSTADWTNISLGEGNTGRQKMEFDLTIYKAPIDGVIAYSAFNHPMTDWPNIPMSLQIGPADGVFNVRNGSVYMNDAKVSYKVGVTYHVIFRVDLDKKTYSVDVATEDQKAICIAENYAFRTGAPATADIGNLLVRGGANAPAGQFMVTNHTISKDLTPVPVNKTALEAALKDVVPEADKDKYTADSWKIYADALKKANEVNADKDATQDEVDKAAAALVSAKGGLKPVETTPDPGPEDPEPEPVKLPFVDVSENDWFYEGVYYNYVNKIVEGKDKTHFAPYENLARAQFAVILHRIAGKPEVKDGASFPDVLDGQWYTDAVLWAAGKDVGVITGYTDTGLFGTADNITREQMAVMMYRYAEFKGYTVNEKAGFDKFTDGDKVSEFAKEAVEWAVANSIITGKDEGTRLDPQGNTSRAECSLIVQRFMENIK